MTIAITTGPGSFGDRAVGCLLGCAIGDALGVTNEFVERWRVTPLTSIVGGGWLKREPGEWSDDTSMSLALADSLLVCGELDETDFLDRLIRWFRHGDYACTGKCDDIGLLTRKALTSWMFFRQIPPGRTDRLSAGNGSLVRMAPVAIRFAGDPIALCDAAFRQSRCTHGCKEAVDACTAFGELMAEALNGGSIEVLRPRSFPGSPSVARTFAGSWRDRSQSSIRSGGYVIETLEAALWAVGNTDSFEGAVLAAANLGDDADTTAAVAGQLADAIYGAAAIPEPLKRPIAWRARIERTALQLGSAGAFRSGTTSNS